MLLMGMALVTERVKLHTPWGVLIIKLPWFSRFAYVHINEQQPWDLTTKCVDYTGILIFKCSH